MAAVQPLLHLQQQVTKSVVRIRDAVKEIAKSGTDQKMMVQLKVNVKLLELQYRRYSELYRQIIATCEEEEQYQVYDEAFVDFDTLHTATSVLVETRLEIAASGVAQTQLPTQSSDATLKQSVDNLSVVQPPVTVCKNLASLATESVPFPQPEPFLKKLQPEEPPNKENEEVSTCEVNFESETIPNPGPSVVKCVSKTTYQFPKPDPKPIEANPFQEEEVDPSRLDPDPPSSVTLPVSKPEEPPPTDESSDSFSEGKPGCVCLALVTASPSSDDIRPTKVRKLDVCSACLSSHPIHTNQMMCLTLCYPIDPDIPLIREPDIPLNLDPGIPLILDPGDLGELSSQTQSLEDDCLPHILCSIDEFYFLSHSLERPSVIQTPRNVNVCVIPTRIPMWFYWNGKASVPPNLISVHSDQKFVPSESSHIFNVELTNPKEVYDVVPPVAISLHSCNHPPILV